MASLSETHVCPVCETEYDSWNDARENDECDADAYLPCLPSECGCYKCEGAEYEVINGTEMITNNMEYHTYGQECSTCGTPRTEYRDLGRKGRYVCPEC